MDIVLAEGFDVDLDQLMTLYPGLAEVNSRSALSQGSLSPVNVGSRYLTAYGDRPHASNMEVTTLLQASATTIYGVRAALSCVFRGDIDYQGPGFVANCPLSPASPIRVYANRETVWCNFAEVSTEGGYATAIPIGPVVARDPSQWCRVEVTYQQNTGQTYTDIVFRVNGIIIGTLPGPITTTHTGQVRIYAVRSIGGVLYDESGVNFLPGTGTMDIDNLVFATGDPSSFNTIGNAFVSPLVVSSDLIGNGFLNSDGNASPLYPYVEANDARFIEGEPAAASFGTSTPGFLPPNAVPVGTRMYYQAELDGVATEVVPIVGGTEMTTQTIDTDRLYATSVLPSGVADIALGVRIGVPSPVEGEAVFTDPGSHIWIVPPGVFAIHVVAVNGAFPGTSNGPANLYSGGAGGALRYKNNIAVTPGMSITVYVGIISTEDERVSTITRTSDGTAMLVPVDAAFNGGAPGTAPSGWSKRRLGGGGAGGYIGVGGNGGAVTAAANTLPFSTGVGQIGVGGTQGGDSVALSSTAGVNTVARGYGVSLYGHGSETGPLVGGGTGSGAHSISTGGVRIIWGTGASYPYNAE